MGKAKLHGLLVGRQAAKRSVTVVLSPDDAALLYINAYRGLYVEGHPRWCEAIGDDNQRIFIKAPGEFTGRCLCISGNPTTWTSDILVIGFSACAESFISSESFKMSADASDKVAVRALILIGWGQRKFGILMLGIPLIAGCTNTTGTLNSELKSGRSAGNTTISTYAPATRPVQTQNTWPRLVDAKRGLWAEHSKVSVRCLNRHFPNGLQFVANRRQPPPPMEENTLCGHPTAPI